MAFASYDSFRRLCLSPSPADVFQHSAGASGAGGREKCGEEEFDRRSVQQRAHPERYGGGGRPGTWFSAGVRVCVRMRKYDSPDVSAKASCSSTPCSSSEAAMKPRGR